VEAPTGHSLRSQTPSDSKRLEFDAGRGILYVCGHTVTSTAACASARTAQGPCVASHYNGKGQQPEHDVVVEVRVRLLLLTPLWAHAGFFGESAKADLELPRSVYRDSAAAAGDLEFEWLMIRTPNGSVFRRDEGEASYITDTPRRSHGFLSDVTTDGSHLERYVSDPSAASRAYGNQILAVASFLVKRGENWFSSAEDRRERRCIEDRTIAENATKLGGGAPGDQGISAGYPANNIC